MKTREEIINEVYQKFDNFDNLSFDGEGIADYVLAQRKQAVLEIAEKVKDFCNQNSGYNCENYGCVAHDYIDTIISESNVIKEEINIKPCLSCKYYPNCNNQECIYNVYHRVGKNRYISKNQNKEGV